jgi:hypothetical protein
MHQGNVRPLTQGKIRRLHHILPHTQRLLLIDYQPQRPKIHGGADLLKLVDYILKRITKIHYLLVVCSYFACSLLVSKRLFACSTLLKITTPAQISRRTFGFVVQRPWPHTLCKIYA